MSSTAALIPPNRHNATSSFAAVKTPKQQDIPLDERLGTFSTEFVSIAWFFLVRAINYLACSVFRSALPMTIEGPKRPERPVKTGLSGLEDIEFTIAPIRPPPARAEPVENADQYRPYDPHAYNTPRPTMNTFFGEDLATTIATQKQTIARLLEEAGYTNRALERLKNVEKSECTYVCQFCKLFIPSFFSSS